MSSVALFGLGCFIAYLTLEKALEFLISWAGHDVHPTFQVSKYISLVTLMASPSVSASSSRCCSCSSSSRGAATATLLRAWRYAIVGIVVVAAVITPSGDPISMTALGGADVVLYFARRASAASCSAAAASGAT